MGLGGLEVRLSLHEKNALLANIAKRYKQAEKKEKQPYLPNSAIPPDIIENM